MNNLNVTKFNVQELETKELVELEGGIAIWLLEKLGGHLLSEFMNDPKQFTSSGWDSTPYGHYGGARP